MFLPYFILAQESLCFCVRCSSREQMRWFHQSKRFNAFRRGASIVQLDFVFTFSGAPYRRARRCEDCVSAAQREQVVVCEGPRLVRAAVVLATALIAAAIHCVDTTLRI